MKRHSYHRTAFTIGQDDQHSDQVTGTHLVRLTTGNIRKRLYSYSSLSIKMLIATTSVNQMLLAPKRDTAADVPIFQV